MSVSALLVVDDGCCPVDDDQCLVDDDLVAAFQSFFDAFSFDAGQGLQSQLTQLSVRSPTMKLILLVPTHYLVCNYEM